MRKRMLTAVILIVVAGAASLAQTPSAPTPEPLTPGLPGSAESLKPDPIPSFSPEALPDTPAATVDPPPPGEAPSVAPIDDPMVVVEAFVTRNRKEADDSVRALTQEAATLRARLQKVEKALARWQAVSAALKTDPAPSPTPDGVQTK